MATELQFEVVKRPETLCDYFWTKTKLEYYTRYQTNRTKILVCFEKWKS